MKIALVSMQSKSSLMLVKELKKYFKTVDLINIKDIEARVSVKALQILYKGKEFDGTKYDCVYPKSSFRYALMLKAIASSLQGKCYVPVSSEAYSIANDKALTHFVLSVNNIPQPNTFLSSSVKAAKKILKEVSYPIVMKIPTGTQGKGVMFADSFASASSFLDTLERLDQPFLVQEYVETNGTDTRAIVCGDKVIAAMKRKAVKEEKRANIHQGGTGESCILDDVTNQLAVKTTKAMNADICAVDILQGHKGPVVIEVNLSPGLQGITKVTKINVAQKIARFLSQKTKEFSKAGKAGKAEAVFRELGIEKAEAGKEIITSIDFRGNRMLLPEIVTKISKFNEEEDLSIKIDEGKLEIKKLNIKE